MTVGELRAALEGVADDHDVVISKGDEMWALVDAQKLSLVDLFELIAEDDTPEEPPADGK